MARETMVKNAQIKAVAAAVPKKKIRCSDLNEIFGAREVARAVEVSGISELRIVEEGQTASDLCAAAAEALLPDSGLDMRGIVFVSQTPDFIFPATGAILQDRLGLPQDIVTYDVNSGCTGYIHGLLLASLLSSASGGDILLLSGDSLSRHICEQDRSLRLIMGDGGSATIVGPSEGESLPFRFFTDGSRSHCLIIPDGGSRRPATKESALVKEREGGNWRSDLHFFMDGMEVMKFALTDAVRLLRETLSEWGQPLDTYLIHQANKLIVESLVKKLKLPPESVPLAVDGYGNTGPASIPLTLCHAFSTVDKNPGKCLLAGFGVGLTAGTVIADLSSTVVHPVIEVGK